MAVDSPHRAVLQMCMHDLCDLKTAEDKLLPCSMRAESLSTGGLAKTNASLREYSVLVGWRRYKNVRLLQAP